MPFLPCPECGGSGYKPVKVHEGESSTYVSRMCEACGGAGETEVLDDVIPCPVCGGEKVVRFPSEWELIRGHWTVTKHRTEQCHSCEGAGVVPYREYYD